MDVSSLVQKTVVLQAVSRVGTSSTRLRWRCGGSQLALSTLTADLASPNPDVVLVVMGL